jgi:hypothetical protein
MRSLCGWQHFQMYRLYRLHRLKRLRRRTDVTLAHIGSMQRISRGALAQGSMPLRLGLTESRHHRKKPRNR